jgi:hypothetical protein
MMRQRKEYIITESGSKDFSSGYFDGLMKGCKNAGRSEENCNVQTDANTP